jgi:hypothetical protein
MRLSVPELRSQIENINTDLLSKQDAMEDVLKALHEFIEEESLQGEGYTNAKNYFRNTYVCAAQGLILAYSSFLQANRICMGNLYMVGDDGFVMDTDEIYDTMSEMWQLLSQVESLEISSAYSYVTSLRGNIQSLEEKVQRVFDFDSLTSSLYEETRGYLERVSAGVSEFKGNHFDVKLRTFYFQSADTLWNRELNVAYEQNKVRIILEKCMTVDESGNVVYNKNEIFKILGKDASEITDTEYQVLAYVYGVTKDISLQESMLRSCFDLHPDSPLTIEEGMGLKTIILVNQKSKKLDNILLRLEGFGAGIYAVSRELNKEERKQLYRSGLIERLETSKAVLRHLVNGPDTLAVVSQTSLFGNSSKSYIFSVLELSRDKDGNICLNYCADKGSIPFDAYKSSVHQVQISSMFPGDTASDKFEKDDIRWYAAAAGLSTINKEVMNQSVNRIIDNVVSTGIGEIPGAGIVSSFIDIMGGSLTDLENVKNYNGVMQGVDIRQIVRYLDLNAIRITDTTSVTSNMEYQISEGIGDSMGSITTRQRIDNFNRNLSSGGKYHEIASRIGYDEENPITMEDVLERMEEIMKINNKIEQYNILFPTEKINIDEIYD